MKLIDLLVKELPKRGGWPEVVADYKYYAGSAIAFDEYDREVHGLRLDIKISEKTARKVTREQYESALAASDGWIQWAGGECPVDSDAIVEVKFRNPNRYRYSNDRAGDFDWSHDGIDGDIIAYRMHQQTKSEQVRDDAAEAGDEADLNECIGQAVDTPDWNGEGLPPVGTICQAKVPRSITGWEWRKVKVVESGIPGAEKEVLVYDLETTLPAWTDEFRPLRTEAERAREDAETAIRTCLAGTGAGITRLAAKGIYDAIAAGKIPGVKLEVK